MQNLFFEQKQLQKLIKYTKNMYDVSGNSKQLNSKTR